MKLNKSALIIILIISAVTSIHAQFIDNAFVKNMPDNILPAMSKDNRLELLEYYKAGQKDTIKNVFQNGVFVLDYDSVNQFISIQSTVNTRFEMKLFPTKDKIDSTSYVIGVINTVCAPTCSSYIRFYDSKWNKIEVDFKSPSALDWLNKKEEETYGVKIAEIFKSSFIEYHFDKKQNEIILKNNSADLLSVEDKLLIKSYLTTEDKIYNVRITGNRVTIKP